jgi:hypothetical protein
MSTWTDPVARLRTALKSHPAIYGASLSGMMFLNFGLANLFEAMNCGIRGP